MTNANVLIFMHGIVEDSVPSNHTAQYDALWCALIDKQPSLRSKINGVVRVEWGHAPLPLVCDDDLCPDERLTGAENTMLAATSYEVIKSQPTEDDTFLHFEPDMLQRAVVRPLTRPIKNTIITLGLSDAFYYCTPDGECAVRNHVYSQVLAGLEPHKGAAQVALHVIGHSHGATVGFDFLFGLLAPDHNPGFVQDGQSDPLTMGRYTYWRERAQQGTLKLGSKASFGSQVGLMMLRKQKTVEMLFRKQLLDPTVIGVPKRGTVKWKIFYDTDDILGYPARRLFDAVGTIKEYEVDADWNPIKSHTAYWTNSGVQTEIASLIAANVIP